MGAIDTKSEIPKIGVMYFVNCSKKTDVMLVFLLFLKNTPYNLQ